MFYCENETTGSISPSEITLLSGSRTEVQYSPLEPVLILAEAD